MDSAQRKESGDDTRSLRVSSVHTGLNLTRLCWKLRVSSKMYWLESSIKGCGFVAKMIVLPGRRLGTASESMEVEGSVVIVGANGSGKSRLGAWIEQQSKSVHRISAQRSLMIPEFAPMKSVEQAENELIYGNSQVTNNKAGNRWQGKLTTSLLNDYDKVLSTIFAKEEQRNREFVAAFQAVDDSKRISLEVPESPLDTLRDVWADILPHRRIVLQDSKVRVVDNDGSEYHGSEMSDGERVALYLIGQCLCAPKESILVIDEPEIHLHRSLMSRLWTRLETVRADSLFVYITHDLDFAATRRGTKLIYVKSYVNKDRWEWDEVPFVQDVPEILLVEIMGTRKQILFVEGTRDSLDVAIYSALYPDHHVIPRGSCTEVIESVKALRANRGLLWADVHGIVDVDYRSPEEMQTLEAEGIYTINVAEIENLLCTPEVVSIVAEHMGLSVSEKVKESASFIFTHFKQELETQILNRTAAEVKYRLSVFDVTSSNKSDLVSALSNSVSRINIDDLYETYAFEYREALEKKDIVKALLLYNRKSLARRVSIIFGMKDGVYETTVLNLLKTSLRERIVCAMKAYVPSLHIKE